MPEPTPADTATDVAHPGRDGDVAALRAERDALRAENDELRKALADLGRLLEGLAERTADALADAQRTFDRLPG